MKYIAYVLAALVLAGMGYAVEAQAPSVTIREALQQGGFWVGQVNPGSKVFLNGKPVWSSSDGLVVLGFARDVSPAQVLKVCGSDGTCATQTLHVKARTYITQKITHVEQNKVEPSTAEQKQMAEDNKATQAARDASMAARDTEPFALAEGAKLPIAAPTSGVFGSRRTYNGQERSWHKGHDLAAKTGTPIHAPADAVVRLARPTFMSGNLIMLDHGGGITTVYAHLSQMDVAVGQLVKAGDVIGKVGTTGRSTGPHLHWGLYWQNEAIDPILWVRPTSN